jgi:hypothetical protein
VVAPIIDGADVRCIVGAESGPGEQLLIDSASPRVYAKHSTARRVAFEADGWSEDSALPVWPEGVGPTICHDMYLALLDHSLASRGARTLVNPGFDDVVRQKWEIVLRGRAIENRAPIACTMNQRRGGPRGPSRAFCWVFDAAGKPVALRSPDGLTFAYGDAPGTLYVTATDGAPIEPAEAAPVASNPGGLPVSLREDRRTVGRDSVTWGLDGCLHGYRVVCLNDRQWMDPCRWVEPLIDQALNACDGTKARCLYWARVDDAAHRDALVIAMAKAVELSCPTVLQIDGTAPVLVEVSSNYKHVHCVAGDLRLNPTFQRGLESAFKMIQGKAERAGAWRGHLAQYRSAVRSPADRRPRIGQRPRLRPGGHARAAGPADLRSHRRQHRRPRRGTRPPRPARVRQGHQDRPGPAAPGGRPRHRPRHRRPGPAGRSCSTAAAPGWTGTPPPAACATSPSTRACGSPGNIPICSGTPSSRPCWMPGLTCATSRSPPGTPIRARPLAMTPPERARQNLDRHPNYILAAYMASGT